MLAGLWKKIRGVWATAFKRCTLCRHLWPTQDSFIDDPDLSVTGYMANFDRLELGIFLFDHIPCRTTLSLPAERFRNLYDGPVYTGRKTGTDECPGYCLDKEAFRPCPAECECAYVREVLHAIVLRKNRGGTPSGGPDRICGR